MGFSVKNLAAFILIVLGTVSCSSDNNNNTTPTYSTTTFSATLIGNSEIPPNASTAAATATLVYDAPTKKFTITIIHNVQDANDARIQKGAIGASGPVIFSFPDAVSPTTYTSPILTDEQIADLFAGMYYVNIDSPSYPDGEIRGQLTKP